MLTEELVECLEKKLAGEKQPTFLEPNSATTGMLPSSTFAFGLAILLASGSQVASTFWKK
jgi:hypothetical protein